MFVLSYSLNVKKPDSTSPEAVRRQQWLWVYLNFYVSIMANNGQKTKFGNYIPKIDPPLVIQIIINYQHITLNLINQTSIFKYAFMKCNIFTKKYANFKSIVR